MNESQIFAAASKLASPGERDAYLDEACAGNPALRADVAALLRARDDDPGFLEQPPAALEGTVDAAQGDRTPGGVSDAGNHERPGVLLAGRYKLLEQIGEGGMGAVWMAQQTEPVKRLVAVKLIKAGMDGKQMIARFEAERQALALMDHPNIARVHDAGATPEGRLFFAMELVKGVPITKYCDDHHLTPRQRLELFVPVCQAIQHAHQKGVIHRDVKPSNVLVALYDDRPVPKVIDFGVAKATGQQLTERTLHTGFGAVVGTVEYMSPEQASFNQLDVDTRSDVYSLGVLLYELLAGSPPFSRKDLERVGLLEMLRVIREQEPSKPSTKLSTADGLPTLAADRGTEPAKLTRLVRGELDWIVMKSLEKDRTRRYETANGFAMDVQRYLADEAVLACPPSAGYRLRKFARRNKGALAVAALVLSFLVVLGSGVGWALRDRTARQSRIGAQVDVILGEVDRLEREQKWPEALAAARRAEVAAAGGEADAETARRVRQRLKDHEFLDRLEQIRMQKAAWVGRKFDFAGANRDYARAFRDYGVDVEALAVETSIDRLKARPELATPLAAALDYWVEVRRAASAEGTADWKRLVAVARGIDPDPLRDQLRSTWGQPASDTKTQDELRRLGDSVNVRAQHPATLLTLAITLQRVKQFDSAIRLLRDAQYVYPGDFWLNFELARALNQQKDHEGSVRFYTAAVSIRPNSTAVHNNLGKALHDQKKLDEAVAACRKAIELDPNFALAHNNLGAALLKQKKLDEAVAAIRKATELDPNWAEAHHNLGKVLLDQKKLHESAAALRKAIQLDPNFALTHINLGNALYVQGKLDEAVAAYRKAIELDPNWAEAHYNLGNLLLDQKKLDEAVTAYRKAIELDTKGIDAHNNLGLALYRQGNVDEAISAFRKAIELNPKHAAAYSNLGNALSGQGKVDEAIAAYRKVLELDPKNADTHNNLGNALSGQGKLDEAVAAFRKAIELVPNFALAHNNLGLALYHQNKLDEAISAFRKAIELDPKNASTYHKLGNALYRQGKVDEAIAAFRKAIELNPKFAPAYSNLGVALLAQMKLDEAVAAFRKAYELSPNQAGSRQNLCIVLGKRLQQLREMKNAAGCLAVATEYEALNPTARVMLYDAACVRALCASAIREDPKTPAADAARLAREQADLAMAWLHKAVAAGYKDARHVKQDKDLDALHDRADFKKLLAELEKKGK